MPQVLSVDTRQIRRLADDVKKLSKSAYPIAVERTLNDSAKTARTLSRERIKKQMINRNAFTRNSIRFVLAKKGPVSGKFSTVGSIAEYLEGQEFGRNESKKTTKGGESGVAIPTSFSAGQDEKSKPRLKIPRAGNKMARINLNRKKSKTSNKKQSLLLSVNRAVFTGRRYFFHDFGGSKSRGIFKAVGGSKSSAKKGGWPKGARISLVWSMRQRSYTIPKNPWLKPATNETQKMMPAFYASALKFQIERQKLFSKK